MSSNKPVVSVIIPTYNYARYLSRAIKSCKDQSYKNLEIMVIDDGSTDDTRKLARTFGKKIVYVYQENSGVSAARNKGLQLATGEFIAFLDADDYLTKDSVESRVNVLLRRPDIDIVFSETYSEEVEGGPLSYKPDRTSDFVSDQFYEELLLHHLRFQTSAAMVRSSLAKQFIFPLHLSNGEDIAYFTKIFFAAKGYFLVQPTVVNVRHADSLRHNVEEIKKQDMALVTTIFDDPFYRGALEYMRKEFTVSRHLELFRRFYLSGEKRRARSHYYRALAAKPASLLNVDYLIKFLKSFF